MRFIKIHFYGMNHIEYLIIYAPFGMGLRNIIYEYNHTFYEVKFFS